MPSHSSFKLSCLWLFFKRTFQNTTVLHKFHLKIASQSWITCICQRFKKWKGQNQMVFWKGPNIRDRGLKKSKQTTNTKPPTLPLLHTVGKTWAWPTQESWRDRAGCRMKGSYFPASAPISSWWKWSHNHGLIGKQSRKGKTLYCLKSKAFLYMTKKEGKRWWGVALATHRTALRSLKSSSLMVHQVLVWWLQQEWRSIWTKIWKIILFLKNSDF